jgi:muramoyltetrapeptide carboxypeptidase LdcA involved in peptidoglycan recycling
MKYRNITYPAGFGENLGIGVTAPSSGLGTEVFIKRFELVAKQLTEKGYNIIEGNCLRENDKHVSGTSKERADNLLKLWLNPAVDTIIPPWGGEVLIEILDLIDFDRIMDSPAKWIMGYSDTSTLLFALTLKTGIATAHGINFMDLIGTQGDPLSCQALEILKRTKGETFTQQSSEKYQAKFTNFSDNLETTYNLTEPTEWKLLDGSSSAKFSGRLIGGCIDVIENLAGTPYGDMAHFNDTFRQDGTIVYLENCELTPCALTRALWQMRMANWFDGASGVVFGRNAAEDPGDASALGYLEVLGHCMKGLNIPIVYDADIGHKPPNMTLINGALAELSVDNGKATLIQSLV